MYRGDGLFSRNHIFDSHLVEDVGSDVGIDSGEGIVKKVDVGIGVNRSSNADALFLTPRQIDSLENQGMWNVDCLLT